MTPATSRPREGRPLGLLPGAPVVKLLPPAGGQTSCLAACRRHHVQPTSRPREGKPVRPFHVTERKSSSPREGKSFYAEARYNGSPLLPPAGGQTVGPNHGKLAEQPPPACGRASPTNSPTTKMTPKLLLAAGGQNLRMASCRCRKLQSTSRTREGKPARPFQVTRRNRFLPPGGRPLPLRRVRRRGLPPPACGRADHPSSSARRPSAASSRTREGKPRSCPAAAFNEPTSPREG